ncbi:MAG: ABC transporter permease [Aquabacterium sp.]|uniref:ABC transporter permease n=1 Tax=Aquabacterium sp. TaxID=1872578 RepID=UPI002726B088|nr:ABC transporter permease [Aquabacterium sp.]MDO9005326.1 ABC transporter permease [Aquabacterium sp.]
MKWLDRTVIGIPFVWLLLFFMLPFLIVLRISVSDMDMAGQLSGFKLSNYTFLAQDALYVKTYLASLKYAAITTGVCLLLAYPFAYFMARADKSVQPALLLMVMLPFWTSFLLRVYAWKGLLADGGWVATVLNTLQVDQLLMALDVIPGPGQYLNTAFSLVLGMVYTYLPFMILPLYANLSKQDGRLLEAAHDLGASPWVAFWKVTVPLSRPGILAGSMLVFIPCVGEYVVPELLGGPQTLMIGRVLWDEFFANNDWPMASSVAVVMVLLILVPLALFSKARADAQEARA